MIMIEESFDRFNKPSSTISLSWIALSFAAGASLYFCIGLFLSGPSLILVTKLIISIIGFISFGMLTLSFFSKPVSVKFKNNDFILSNGYGKELAEYTRSDLKQIRFVNPKTSFLGHFNRNTFQQWPNLEFLVVINFTMISEARNSLPPVFSRLGQLG